MAIEFLLQGLEPGKGGNWETASPCPRRGHCQVLFKSVFHTANTLCQVKLAACKRTRWVKHWPGTFSILGPCKPRLQSCHAKRGCRHQSHPGYEQGAENGGGGYHELPKLYRQEERRALLWRDYWFSCQCPVCQNSEEDFEG